jgi:hypothetical protein
MITIGGKKYSAETVSVFDSYSGFPAKIVTGVNTKSGEAVAIFVSGNWQFVNPLVE